MPLLSTIIVQHSAPQYTSLISSLKMHYDPVNTATAVITKKHQELLIKTKKYHRWIFYNGIKSGL